MKPSDDAPASNPFESILRRSGAGPTASSLFENPTGAEVNAANEELRVNYHPIPEATTGPPGSVGVFNSEAGEELKAFANTAPSENFAPFVDSFTSYLCAGTGMAHEVLLMKFGLQLPPNN